MLEPRGGLDVLIALEGVAEELDLGRRAAGDHQDADLLADDADLGRGRVVILRQLGAGVLDAGAELVLADDAGDEVGAACAPQSYARIIEIHVG